MKNVIIIPLVFTGVLKRLDWLKSDTAQQEVV